ncbi:glycosyltransferase family 2 protein [candidate division WOR-3 bacterium]|nr:glycosyltransferase family 2 protein [candidate division WOR-3 bacterium]
MDVSETGVVIPAYNAESTINNVIAALRGIGFRKEEIIVVDDGSCDLTADIVRSNGVGMIRHEQNKGKGAALKTGFHYAKEHSLTGVVTIDADGQHQIRDIPSLLEHRRDYDLIIGTRCDMRTMPFVRKVVNRITSLVISVLSQAHVPDVQCGLRYIRMTLLDRITLHTNRYQTESELVYRALRAHFRVGFVPVATHYNTEKSYIHPFIDTIRFTLMAVGFLWR